MTAEFDDDTLATLPISEQEAASTGAAADAAEADEMMKALPRILRIAMLRGRADSYVRERLIGEIAELCPNLPETTIWANANTTDAAINLAAELDRAAAANDCSELRSIADCVRMVSLPVPHSEALIAEHRRVGKSLVMAAKAVPDKLDVDMAADVEALVWGWAALPIALPQLPLYADTRALTNAYRVADKMARQRIEQAIEAVRQEYEERTRKEKEQKVVHEDAAPTDHKSDVALDGRVVVCSLGDASLKNPKLREIVAPLKAAINTAMPIAAAPPLHEARRQLLFEFPYAQEVIDFCLTDLIGRTHVHLRPLLLVGSPGGGKSRFGRRLGEVLGVHVWRVDAARSDGAAFGGTDKRWHSAEPCHPFLAIAQGLVANPIVLLDEIEKAPTRSDYGRLWDALLGFLELETAARYPDPALQTLLDLSMVSYIATANSIDQLPSPLKDRFRVIEFPKPRPVDLEALLPTVIANITVERGLDARWVTPLTQDEVAAASRFWHGGSVRKLRRVVEAMINAREKVEVRQ
ncbi:ATPase associated with various cellular activities AAA_5 [Rhodopseudomonas palustris TIE-1]|uniref:AAA family ATPase n=1 Tax=Rhodopseudomonas TaxID=1073 RepID=UPI000164BDF6|nr:MULTISPECIES: AAA family ATPase [Rhodopseudomonas]ACE99690.1 ATPase associated with various cellular activities AAA_5 [Rhodopseudomonas palustris TIE-1]